MPVNDNHVNIEKYRGKVSPCPFCKNATLPDVLRTYCPRCVTNGYVAKCLNCEDGKVKEVAPWDGASAYESVCAVCGGYGVLPAKKPVESVIEVVPDPQPVEPPAKPVTSATTDKPTEPVAQAKPPQPATAEVKPVKVDNKKEKQKEEDTAAVVV